MDEFTNTVRSGARQLAEQIMPAPVATVRARGEHLRHKRTVGTIALAAAGVAVIGTTAFAAFGGTNNGAGVTIPPGSTVTPGPTLSTPSIAPSTSTSSSGASNQAPIQTPTESLHTSPPSSASSPSTASTPSTPAACGAADLAVTSSPWTGRTGHAIGIFLFHNTSSTTCRISGYPLVSGVDDHGTTTTTATHTLTGWAGNLSSVPTVDLQPGGYASAGVEWKIGTVDGSMCALVSTFEVAPPSGGTRTKIPAGKQSATDGPACAEFEIHPVVAGFDSGYFYPPYNPPVTNGN